MQLVSPELVKRSLRTLESFSFHKNDLIQFLVHLLYRHNCLFTGRYEVFRNLSDFPTNTRLQQKYSKFPLTSNYVPPATNLTFTHPLSESALREVTESLKARYV